MFHENLIRLRKTENISREQLAKALGITYSALSKYETGNREPEFAILIKIAKFFNVTTDYLLSVNDNPLDSKKLSCSQKKVMNFFLEREDLFFENQPAYLLDALEQFEVFYTILKRQQKSKENK